MTVRSATKKRRATKTPAFWLLIIANTLHSLAGPALTLHCIPFLTDIGIDPLQAAGMLSIRVLASIPSRLVGGFLADRVKKNQLRFVVGSVYLLQAIGTFIFLQNSDIIGYIMSTDNVGSTKNVGSTRM